MIGIKNPLIKSAWMVFAFWWITIFILWITIQSIRWDDKARLYGAIEFGMQALPYTIAGIVLSFVVLFGINLYRHRRIEFLLRNTTQHGMHVSIGSVPDSMGIPKMLRDSKLALSLNDPISVWSRYTGKHSPDHRAFFQQLIDLYAANMDVPATVVKSAHGGLSLVDHSINTMREMLQLAESFEYTGSKTHKGYEQRALADHDYIFDKNDPLIGIIGFCHDIGKIDAYKRKKEGGFVEVKKYHDRVGAWLLSRLPGIHKLPPCDKEDMLYVVSCYHHPSAMPLVASDRAWALMELLILADESASRKENRKSSLVPYSDNADDSVITNNDENAQQTADMRDDVQTTTQPILSEEDSELWTHVVDVLLAPGRINGNKADIRIGYKSGKRVFVLEETFRRLLADSMGDASLAEAMPLGDGRVDLTKRVLKLLSDKNILVQSIDGQSYSSDRALFYVTFLRADKKPYPAQPHMFIIEPGDVIPGLREIKDSRGMPGDIKPVWGLQSAQNKSLKKKPGPKKGGKKTPVALNQKEENVAISASDIDIFIKQLNKSSTNDTDDSDAVVIEQPATEMEPSTQWIRRALKKVVTLCLSNKITCKEKENCLAVALDDRARVALGENLYSRLIELENRDIDGVEWTRGQTNQSLIVIRIAKTIVDKYR